MFQPRKGRMPLNIALVLIVALLAYAPSFAQGQGQKFRATPLTPDSIFQGNPEKLMPHPTWPTAEGAGAGTELVSVIVKLEGDSLATYSGGVSGLAPTGPLAGVAGLDAHSPNSQAYLRHLAKKHIDFEATALGAVPNAWVTHRFDVILNAIAMLVPADHVKTLSTLPGVEAVYPDPLLHPDTDNSPQFIGAPTMWNQLGGQEKAGEGVIVGVLDTGIWPEHPSFSDPDPSGKAYSLPPPPLSGTRDCRFIGGSNPGPAFTCNRKLIGARRFMSTYDALIGLLPGEFTSARDDDGHGTHTSSTAAGNASVPASIFGISRGPVSGIAPRAHVIMYKVCGASGCFGSDSAAAIQQAILDGVNVINFSISGGDNPYDDVVELAFLNAYAMGVFVAASAGNSGPGLDTTAHRGPWVTTVAASTQNRAFQTTAVVTATGGASLSLTGASITAGITTPKPVVVAPDPLCIGPYAPGTFTGKVVVCKRGTNGRAEKGFNVRQGGALGMILYNQSAAVTDLETDNHFLPAVHIQFSQGEALLNFLSANTGEQVSWPAGTKAAAQGDVMASFSSRGGPNQSLGVSKPDVTAPGVQVLAGHSPQHLDVAGGPPGELFQAIAGTSMSSPHVAGAAALLKDLHPNWTPGQIKSALMTTAKTSGVFKEDGVTPAGPFDYGSGRIRIAKAGDPGLTFDESAQNYIALRNELWDANYPSLYVPVMPGKITVKRTVHSELNSSSCWLTSVDKPADINVVVPAQVCVPAGGYSTFSVTINAKKVPIGQVRQALLKLTLGTRLLIFPITIVRREPAVTLDKTCSPGTFPLLGKTKCTITMTNTSYETTNVKLTDVLPAQLKLVPGSVVGATAGLNSLSFQGPLLGAGPPDVDIGPSPAGGYLPLSLFGVTPIGGVGDETIVNFNVPAFQYAGETYTRIGMVSDGYVVVGGGTGSDVQFVNQDLPDPARPNNVLAPFWTDLNPAIGGAGSGLRIALLTDGVNTWIVCDWENVPNFGNPAQLNSFQIWVRTAGVEDITYAYDMTLTNGAGGLLTVGAENRFGNRGGNLYFNGIGALPSSAAGARVTGTPPTPGETHITTFRAQGIIKGNWENCAQMEADIFDGINIDCFAGTVR